MNVVIYPNKRIDYRFSPTLLQSKEVLLSDEKIEQVRRNREEYEAIQKELKDLYFYPDIGC